MPDFALDPKPRPAPVQRRRVAVIVEPMGSPWRGILSGIGRYMREHRPWLIYHHDWTSQSWSWLDDWEGDGIIAHYISDEHAQVIRKRGLPLVDIGTHTEVPAVTIDEAAISRVAAEHLLDR